MRYTVTFFLSPSIPAQLLICSDKTIMTTHSTSFSSPVELYKVLCQAWSAETSSPPHSWSPSNPAKNHCSVTSLLVQDYFGGEILCTRTVGGTHFYNRIDGVKWDLTVSQFAEPIPYEDTLTSRQAALADTSAQKYDALSGRVREMSSAR